MARLQGQISYKDGCLSIDGTSVVRVLQQTQIKQICVCCMEDEIHHGDESFHILFLDHEFLLVGPFVQGGAGAIESLISDNPQIPVKCCFVRSIPYRHRKKGVFGMRLFPIPGLFLGPITDLNDFNIVIPENPYGR